MTYQKSFKVYYIEGGKTLTNGLEDLGTDNDVLELADEMRKNSVVDIYIDYLHGDNESQLSNALMQPIDIDDDTSLTIDEPSFRLPTPTLDDFHSGDEGVNVPEKDHVNEAIDEAEKGDNVVDDVEGHVYLNYVFVNVTY